MSASNELKICQVSTVLDQDWRNLYEGAFPETEREPETRLEQLIKAGRMLLHKTTGANNELLCFSLVSLAPDFHFLAYIATSTTQRSSGIGSKHMRQLIQELKAGNPSSLALLLEIDATSPKQASISDDEKKTRARRLAFYRRLGAKKICRNFQYFAPSRNGNGEEIELDLLVILFGDKPLERAVKSRLVSEIYQRFYCLDADEPLITKVLGQLGGCNSCEEDQDESSGQAGDASANATSASTGGNHQPDQDKAGAATGTAGSASLEPTASTDESASGSQDKKTETAAASQSTEAAAADSAPPENKTVESGQTGQTSSDSADAVVSDCEILEQMGIEPDCDCQEEAEAQQKPEAESSENGGAGGQKPASQESSLPAKVKVVPSAKPEPKAAAARCQLRSKPKK